MRRALIALLLTFSLPAAATEICGDGVDNDANDLADEGCYPAGVTGICESPHGCGVTGAVAPKTGGLVYHTQPDLTVGTPYGPSLRFQRFYTSLYNPGYFGGGVSDYRDSLGYRWQHNYMSWLDKNDTRVVVHLTTGQDVLFVYGSTASGWDNYTAQVGYHFSYLRQRTTSPYDWELRGLDGEVHTFSTSGTVAKLSAIKDPAGNALTLTYDGNGKLYRVTDAQGGRYLQFAYQTTGQRLFLNSVRLYAGGNPQVSSSYAYTSDSLSAVAVGDTITEQLTYNASGYLSSISDGNQSATLLVGVAYLDAVPGKVARAESVEGFLGYAYGDASCDSGAGTFVYFNRLNGSTACDADGDCGTGNYCGGQSTPGTGNSGVCFRARRCVSFDSTAETLVESVSASCPSCSSTEEYVWDTSSGRQDILGSRSPDDVWTSYLYDSNGQVTRMVEGDDDSDASTVPTGARVTYYRYDDTAFPSLVTEIRRKSELGTGTCDESTTTACKRTIYDYSTVGLLDSRQEIGFTYSSAGATVGYNFTTVYTHDSLGRPTAITGPRAGVDDNTEYTYWGSGTGLSEGFRNEAKRFKAGTTYITTSLGQYDQFGHAGRALDANGKATCRAFDVARGWLTSTRIVVNGSHTDCGTVGGSDQTTAFTRDTHGRLTRTTFPLGNCLRREYDSVGRASVLRQTDYDTSTSTCSTTGDYAEYMYDPDGQLVREEWKTSAGTVTRRQEYTRGADRRIAQVVNPVSSNYSKELLYDDDGVPAEVRFEDYATSAARTQWDVDARNRQTAVRRYTTSSSSEQHTLTPAAILDRIINILDPAGHDIDIAWDDLGRKVMTSDADAGTTYSVHDEAGNLVTQVRGYGTADQKTTTWTYDALNRRVTEDNGDAACYSLGGAELRWTYDALPTGVTCPSGSSCLLLTGRLAHVKIKLFCDDTQGDDMFDQATFYSYGTAGRLAEHTVLDDAARNGRIVYTYNVNGRVTREDYPAGSTSGAVFTYGNAAASNDDKVTRIYRGTTTILYLVGWYPFGRLASMQRQAGFTHGTFYPVNETHTYNLAYRLTSILAATTYPDNVFRIDYSEDPRGRYTARNFSYGTSGQADQYVLYDDLSRNTCRTPTSQSTCPTSGTAPLENITYTNGRRSSLILDNAAMPIDTYTTSYVTGSSRIADLTKSNGQKIVFAWDGRGNRTADDDGEYEGPPDYDRRLYTYDGRDNLTTVSGTYRYASADWNPYVLTNAYDERNRRVFKSFRDTERNVEAQWFFYYDAGDHLVQAKHLPSTADSNTYSIYQWYYVDGKPFLQYQIDYPAVTTSRRYLFSDEQGRVHAAWSWPTSGNTTRVWEVEAGLFGWDIPTVGASIYQPFRFPGQQYDRETEAWARWYSGAWQEGVRRPGLSMVGARAYDALVGTLAVPVTRPVLFTHLQVAPICEGPLTGQPVNMEPDDPLMPDPYVSDFPWGSDVPRVCDVNNICQSAAGEDINQCPEDCCKCPQVTAIGWGTYCAPYEDDLCPLECCPAGSTNPNVTTCPDLCVATYPSMACNSIFPSSDLGSWMAHPEWAQTSCLNLPLAACIFCVQRQGVHHSCEENYRSAGASAEVAADVCDCLLPQSCHGTYHDCTMVQIHADQYPPSALIP